MKKLSTLIMIGFLLSGSGLAEAFRPPPAPKDCAICGHVCCCPEVCAAKIKASKTGLATCHNTFATCQMGRSDTDTINFKERESFNVSPAGVVSQLLIRVALPKALMGLEEWPLISETIQDIPTPPPRHDL